MKKQYFPDERDYPKYSIIRHLLEQGLSCTVCWMMTPNDDSGQGGQKGYLKQPNQWRHYDCAVFDYLARVDRESLDIRSIEREDISPIADCRFYWKPFPLESEKRYEYFGGFLNKATGTKLVFIDPDTGLQPANPPKAKDWDKYVRWEEIARIYHAGHSVVVFHYLYLQGETPQKASLIAQRRRSLQRTIRDAEVFVLCRGHLAFYFAVQKKHRDDVRCARAAIIEGWRELPMWLPPIHPGEILKREFLGSMNISQRRLSDAIGVDTEQIHAIVRGESSITVETALLFSRFFENSPEFWMGLQSQYDLETAEDRLAEKLDAVVAHHTTTARH